eukprot:7341992-Lingulodinium_polyedra.AAC.1
MGNTALGWPVVFQDGDMGLVSLSVEVAPDDLAWLVVTDPESFQVQEVEWLSPWAASLVASPAKQPGL